MSTSVPENIKKASNLRLLQRSCDASIVDIDQTATHVVLYEFREQSWFKHNFEGSCFLCHGQKDYLLVILNRNSVENFQLKLAKGIQFQEQAPYLIIKTADKKIHGLYFHNAQELSNMSSAFKVAQDRVDQDLSPPLVENSAPSSMRPSIPAVSSDHTATLMSLLSINATSPPPNNTKTDATTETTPRTPAPPQIDSDFVLDKKSLQLALMSLLNDERFIDLLHSQYLRVVRSRSKKNRGSHS